MGTVLQERVNHVGKTQHEAKAGKKGRRSLHCGNWRTDDVIETLTGYYVNEIRKSKGPTPASLKKKHPCLLFALLQHWRPSNQSLLPFRRGLTVLLPRSISKRWNETLMPQTMKICFQVDTKRKVRYSKDLLPFTLLRWQCPVIFNLASRIYSAPLSNHQ